MTSRTKLVGLIGKRGSGKDTAASVLEAHGFQNVKFAGALKAMLRTLLTYQGVDDETVERMIDGDLKESPTPYLSGRSPRYAMQTLGTEWGRVLMDPDFWLNSSMGRATSAPSVISDVRFPNECAAIRNAGGTLIRLTATGDAHFHDAAAGEHESEKLMDELPADEEITNRRAGPGENIAAAIQEFKVKVLMVADRLVGVLTK
jgi:hypothetical protein